MWRTFDFMGAFREISILGTLEDFDDCLCTTWEYSGLWMTTNPTVQLCHQHSFECVNK